MNEPQKVKYTDLNYYTNLKIYRDYHIKYIEYMRKLLTILITIEKIIKE